MMRRDPYDGKPYYCNSCGLGWAEFQACEDGPCELESDKAAQQRQRRRRPQTSDLANATRPRD